MNRRLPIDRTLGVVLVGTHPWTTSPFDQMLPRTLLPIAHRPLLSYSLTWLRDAGILKAAVCANRETQILHSRLLRHVPPAMSVSYHEDTMPRGAAGAVRDAAADGDADILIVTEGTAIPTVNLRELLAAHEAADAEITVVVHAEPGPHGVGPLQVPSGTYIFDRRVLDAIPGRGFFDIKENLIPALYRAGRHVVAYATTTDSPRVLDPASYLAVNEWMVDRLSRSREQLEGYARYGEQLVHVEASIARDAVLVGPVLIGAGARVHSEAVIVGPTSIGRDVTIGPGALVSRSAIWRRCVIGERVIADQCVLADDTFVEPHAQSFRSIIVAKARREPILVQTVAENDTTSVEWLRRVGRLVNAAAWSRFPAA